MQLNQIKDKLIKNFPNDAVEVFDTRGTGDHFSIIVISNKFNEVSPVNRHRMIYSIFKNEIVTKIHAMQIQTYTLDEWKNKKKSK